MEAEQIKQINNAIVWPAANLRDPDGDHDAAVGLRALFRHPPETEFQKESRSGVLANFSHQEPLTRLAPCFCTSIKQKDTTWRENGVARYIKRKIRDQGSEVYSALVVLPGRASTGFNALQ